MQIVNLDNQLICCTGSCDNMTTVKLINSMPICPDHIEAMKERFK